MLYSKLFGKTIREAPADATFASYKLLYQAGFIRESTPGRYYFLPLGWRVHSKIVEIVRTHMDAAGGQELIAPVLHPLELWQETNRNKEAGFELTILKDRRGGEFVPGGTAEEMIVDLVRKFQLSYKDLPFNIYQFSSKFRDELRARGGLLRVREFVMKDAYSFDTDEISFKKEYQNMWQTYTKIFSDLGLKTVVVESDNGYIGGEYCHEFVVESAVGESKFLVAEDRSYAAHEDVAVFLKDKKNLDEGLQPLTEVAAKRGTTMEDGVKLHRLPLWQQIKDVLFVDENGRFILSIIRGDYDVNEVKLKHIAGCLELRHATAEEIHEKLHSEPGFISPVGIKQGLSQGVKLVTIADDSLKTLKNAYGGSNKLHKDLLNINLDRDYQPDLVGDMAVAKDGYQTRDGKSKLIEKRGIEVGNIFQLGYHYSNLMKAAGFIDKDGKTKKYYMGCYGIGIGRTMAAIVEMHHDEKGMMWPENIAPYQIHLIGIDLQDEVIKDKAFRLYEDLQKQGYEVLFDDRMDVRPGEKFADADLIGIPHRLVISKRTGDKIEYKKRSQKDAQLFTLAELEDKIRVPNNQ